jgi:hypothetical protein
VHYTAELHGATITDYAPISLHCIGDHVHYATQPASEGRQIMAFPVERTDNGTGPSWYGAGHAFYFMTEAGAAQYMTDRHEGVTRIARGDVTERWQGDGRLEDAIP